MRKRYRIRANKMPGDRFWAHYGHFQPNIGKIYSIFGWNPAKIDHIALKQPKKVESRHSIGQDVVYSMVSWVVEFSIRVSKPGDIFA